mgnify:CR=1 FL=1
MLAAAVPNARSAPQPYFDEDQGFALARDDVDLAAAAAVVALNDREAARRKIACRERFGRGAAVHGVGAYRALADRPRITMIRPSRAKHARGQLASDARSRPRTRRDPAESDWRSSSAIANASSPSAYEAIEHRIARGSCAGRRANIGAEPDPPATESRRKRTPSRSRSIGDGRPSAIWLLAYTGPGGRNDFASARIVGCRRASSDRIGWACDQLAPQQAQYLRTCVESIIARGRTAGSLPGSRERRRTCVAAARRWRR